jgi:hypothetical protein
MALDVLVNVDFRRTTATPAFPLPMDVGKFLVFIGTGVTLIVTGVKRMLRRPVICQVDDDSSTLARVGSARRIVSSTSQEPLRYKLLAVPNDAFVILGTIIAERCRDCGVQTQSEEKPQYPGHSARCALNVA